MKKTAMKVVVISRVWPMSGWISSRPTVRAQAEGDADAGHALPLLRLGEHPGGEDDQAGLGELGRLQAERPQVHPARGALHLVADERQGGHDDDGAQQAQHGDPPHAARRQQRHGQHDRRPAPAQTIIRQE
jgi:hypothetical protein